MMDRESPNRRHQNSEEWTPQRITMGNNRKKSALKSEEGSDTLFESFRNLEDAMAMAMEESLKSAGGDEPKRKSLAESFRNLDSVMAQAQLNSLSDDGNRKKPLFESFRDLDEATALAIQNSLNEKDRGVFESFRNMDTDREMSEAMLNSLNFEGNGNENRRTSLFESFSNLDEAMVQAMKNSLSDNDDGGPGNDGGFGKSHFGDGNYQYLERLEEDGSEGDSEFIDDSVRSDSAADIMGRGFKSGLSDSERSAEVILGPGFKTARPDCNDDRRRASVEFVPEPAPNLSRLARRHADRRLRQDRLDAAVNFDDVKVEDNSVEQGGGGRTHSMPALVARVEEQGGARSNFSMPRNNSMPSTGGSERRRSARERGGSERQSARERGTSQRSNVGDDNCSTNNDEEKKKKKKKEKKKKEEKKKNPEVDRLTSLHYSCGTSTSLLMNDTPDCRTKKKKKSSIFGRKSRSEPS